MGVVYLARQTRLNRTIALKMILGGGHAGAQDVLRFLGEAEAAAALQHPHIVQVHECGQHDGLPYFSLEYVAGGSLADRLRDGPLPPREAARLVEQLARAMAYAHGRGVVHRDLKPANVLLADDGAAKVADFGLARRVDAGSGLTATGAVLGTPSYMAPEQAEGKGKQAGPAADVWALGAVLYECLTGRPPFHAPTPLDTLLLVVSTDPVPPRQLQPQVPRDLETVCLKCLRKEPEKRYRGAGELAEDLRRFQAGEPITARPVSPLERAWRWCRRNPAVAGLTAAVALALVAGTVTATVFAVQADRARTNEAARAAEADLARKRSEAQLVRTRNALLTTQLIRVANVTGRDPGAALDLLRDCNACPLDLRDFAWGWHLRCCQRDRLTLEHDGGVSALAFGPDGQTLAVGNEKVVHLWDTVTGRLQRTLDGQGGDVNALAFSPDGKLLASAGKDGAVRLWDPAAGQLRVTLRGHAKEVRQLAFGPDGQTLVSGDEEGSLRLWTAAGKERFALPAHPGKRIGGVVFSPGGKTLATFASDDDVKLWDPETGERKGAVQDKDPRWWELVAFQGDTTLVTVRRTQPFMVLADPFVGEVKLWDVASGNALVTRPLRGPREEVEPRGFSPDGRTLVVGSGRDGTVRLWDATTGTERTVLRDPRSSGGAVAFSPDGRTLATASFFREEGQTLAEVKVWDVEPGRERAVLDNWVPDQAPLRLRAAVTAVAYSPDGSLVASASAGPLVNAAPAFVKVSDARSGELRCTLTGHKGALRCMAFSPDSQTLATGGASPREGGWDGEVKLWDATTGREQATVQVDADRVDCLAFAPDGRTVAVGCAVPPGTRGGVKWEVGLWDVRKGERITSFTDLPKRALALAFSPDGSTLAAGCGNTDTFGEKCEVKLWDVAARRSRATLTGHPAHVLAVAFSPDGKTLAAGSAYAAQLSGSCAVKLWDVATAAELATLRAPNHALRSVAFSPDGRCLATGGGFEVGQGAERQERGEVKLWDPVTGQERGTIHAHQGFVTSLAFAPDGRTLATGSTDGRVKLWETAAPRERAVLPGDAGWSPSPAFLPDGKALAGITDDGARLWDLATGQEKTVFSQLWGCLAVSPDGTTLAGAGGGGTTVLLVDVATAKVRAVLRGHTADVNAVAFTPDGRSVMTGGDDLAVKEWDAGTGRERRTLGVLAAAVRCLAVSADGRTLAAGTGVLFRAPEDKPVTGEVKLWDLATGQEKAGPPGHADSVHSLAFTPDSQLLVSGGADGTVRLWDVAGGRERDVLPDRRGKVNAVAVSPDGKTLAVGRVLRDKDPFAVGRPSCGEVKLWDVATLRERDRFRSVPGTAASVAFSPDGKVLAVGDKVIRLWDVAKGRE
jgi:WD40 repeat protein